MNKWAILVVDDEMPARESISNLIEWEQTDFYIKETALNGVEALKKLDGIDIIITDIQMPVMDGLELIKAVKEIKPEQMMIVLSCHEEFKYAREAMKYGITDYLIKDIITPGDLLGVLKKWESTQLTQTTQEDSGELAKDYYRELLRKRIITPQSLEKELEIPQLVKNLDLSFENMVVFSVALDIPVASVDFYHSNEAKLLITRVSEKLKEMSVQYSGFSCYGKKFRFVFIGNMSNTISQLFYYNECYDVTETIRRGLKKVDIDSVTIGISEKFSDVKRIDVRYLEALNCSKQRIFYGYDKNIFSENLMSKSLVQDIDRLKEKLESIKKNVMHHKLNETHRLLSDLYSKDIKGFMQYNYLKYINHKLFEIIELYCLEYGKEIKEIVDDAIVPYDLVDRLNTTDEMYQYFKGIMKTMMIDDTLVQTRESGYGLKVNQAIQILRKNYRRHIKLDEVAGSLSVHKVYLSRIFKEETGMTVSQFTQKLIVDDGIKLLTDTHMKVYEIAELLGYDQGQTDQFNAIFKKITGMTPTKYRKKYYA